ncbi:Hypothetical_protein [Hexamita inflata]|uniref:Hypothetical_protein n=1 Tax=Hexamita inflata TaxID=28002 RepID=A0AA86NCK8_9EUKA|nr:Hypothetical protein HINF_LOCUS4311 [Hexamita inflata]
MFNNSNKYESNFADTAKLYNSTNVINQLIQNKLENTASLSELQKSGQVQEYAVIARRLAKARKLVNFFSKNTDSVVIQSVFNEILKQIDSESPDFDKQMLEILVKQLRLFVEQTNQNQTDSSEKTITTLNHQLQVIKSEQMLQNDQLSLQKKQIDHLKQQIASLSFEKSELQELLSVQDQKFLNEQQTAQQLYKSSYSELKSSQNENNLLNLQLKEQNAKINELKQTVNVLLKCKDDFVQCSKEVHGLVDQEKQSLSKQVQDLKEEIKNKGLLNQQMAGTMQKVEAQNTDLKKQIETLQTQCAQNSEQIQQLKLTNIDIKRDRDHTKQINEQMLQTQNQTQVFAEHLKNERIKIQNEQHQQMMQLDLKNKTQASQIQDLQSELEQLKQQHKQFSVQVEQEKQQFHQQSQNELADISLKEQVINQYARKHIELEKAIAELQQQVAKLHQDKIDLQVKNGVQTEQLKKDCEQQVHSAKKERDESRKQNEEVTKHKRFKYKIYNRNWSSQNSNTNSSVSKLSRRNNNSNNNPRMNWLTYL